jgi:hypothetical protein
VEDRLAFVLFRTCRESGQHHHSAKQRLCLPHVTPTFPRKDIPAKRDSQLQQSAAPRTVGVPLCIARARGLIEARSSSASNAIAAANLFVLAIQEIGKAGFLVDAHATGLSAPVVTRFYEHQE